MADPRISAESLKRLVGIKDQLQQERLRYDDVWKEAAAYTNPNMSDWDDQPDKSSGNRPEDHAHIYDTTVQRASQMLADGIQGYSFARNQAWNKLALEDAEDLSAADLAVSVKECIKKKEMLAR